MRDLIETFEVSVLMTGDFFFPIISTCGCSRSGESTCMSDPAGLEAPLKGPNSTRSGDITSFSTLSMLFNYYSDATLEAGGRGDLFSTGLMTLN